MNRKAVSDWLIVTYGAALRFWITSTEMRERNQSWLSFTCLFIHLLTVYLFELNQWEEVKAIKSGGKWGVDTNSKVKWSEEFLG